MSKSLIEQYKHIHATRPYGDTSIKNLRNLHFHEKIACLWCRLSGRN